nr:hypothetical protein [Tanacetum cinerariifolium]
LEDITYSDDEDVVGAEADFNNLESSIRVSPISTTRIHKDHSVSQIIGDLSSTTQTKSMTKVVKDQGRLLQMFNDDFHTCMFACFLSHEEPKRVHQVLKDPSWIEAMQEELLQFKMQKVWVLVDLPHEKRAIGTKWVYRNKKDERGIVIRNKARLVAQGHTQEEGIDYEEDFAQKPESEVNVSPSSRYRDLNAEFEDCFDNNSNEVNAADASQILDDPDMLELEDITYSDDEDVVGAEADFNNLESSI